MRRRFTHIAILMAMLLSSLSAVSNDYLEKGYHYTARSGGNGVVHFCIPIWVYGKGNDYYLYCSDAANNGNDSYIWYSTASKDQQRGGNVIRAISFRAASHGKNDEKWDTNEPGEGKMRVHSGIVVLKSTFDGIERQINGDDKWTEPLFLKRKDDDGHKHITYLEFDWYPPKELDDKDFYVGVSANIYLKKVKNEGEGGTACVRCGGVDNHLHWFNLEGEYNGKTGPQSPELFEPYLCTIKEDGVAGYGQAAIPYVTYRTPLSYVTSLKPAEKDSVPCRVQSGTIYVKATDTIQSDFNATFHIIDDQEHHTTRWMKTNSINIPAYHKLYDFAANETRDEQNSVTGNVDLSWKIKNPSVEDLVDGDFFEIQRALDPDFSDAESIALIPYSSDSSVYHYIDNITGIKNPTDSAHRVGLSKYYDIYDSNGQEIARYLGNITSSMIVNGIDVYYRVRRASSAAWEWKNNPYALSASVEKEEWLAPLAQTQLPYEKDPLFEDNRTIHFNIKIDNAVITPPPTPANECSYNLQLERFYNDSVPVILTNNTGDDVDQITISYEAAGSTEWIYLLLHGSFPNGTSKKYNVPSDAKVRFTNKNGLSREMQATGPINGSIVYAMTSIWGTQVSFDLSIDESLALHIQDEFDAQFRRDSLEKYKADLYADLCKKFQTNSSGNTSRCTWDKNAQIILTKYMTDLGIRQDIYVSQDSIKRQADGSWIAHVTDVADAGCTHYEYSVRIDPSHSLLNFNDTRYLNPIPIEGEDLYTADVAKINSFTATRGTEKQGVLLQWEPTPGGVEDYVLARRNHGSTDPFDTLIVTTDAGYRDIDTVIPNKHYDYRLTIRFTCNGNYSETSDTIEGWRSPYGSIAGRVKFDDGSGLAGITVSIKSSKDSTKVITKADGSYFADSLLYDAKGTDYSVTVEAQSGHYVHNNGPSAAVNLSMKRCEATDIDFVNIDAVRLTGRVLYKGTTIPVYGAKFKLNGQPVSYAGAPVSTGHDGKFQMTVPTRAPFTLQVYMEGHTFTNDGFLLSNNSDTLTVEKALDGVRFWDETTVKLAGRVVGGNDQGNKPLGFGLSKNNLGDDLKIVMQLEGDNISYMISDPQDPTITERDTAFAHLVHTPNGIDTVGNTAMNISQKRLTIHPDPQTGEYEVDIWPVRYKITQVTAKGYATLYGDGQGMDVVDLTDAVLKTTEDVLDKDTVNYGATYSRIFHSPIKLEVMQRNYGVKAEYYGDEQMMVSSLMTTEHQKVKLAEKDKDGNIHYLFGYPIFHKGTYTYRAEAYEEYFYNNDKLTGRRDQVNMHGGTLRVHNGMHSNNKVIVSQLDSLGRADFNLTVDDPEFSILGEAALRTVSVSAEIENDYIQAGPIQAFITGNRIEQGNLRATEIGFNILDVLRDPPGEKSYSWIESGSKYSYSCVYNLDVKAGLRIGMDYGTGITNNIGVFSGAGAGTFAGNEIASSKKTDIEIPLTFDFKGNWNFSYDFRTNKKITTSSSIVGSDADIFLGVAQSVLYGEAKAIRIIDDSTFIIRQPAVQAGTLKVLASDTTLNGQVYHLVIGSETILGSKINNTFVYTQEYIINTLIPNLVRERNSLLLDADKAWIQEMANLQHKTFYKTLTHNADSIGLEGTYEPVNPKDSAGVIYCDEIEAYNNLIAQWVTVLYNNEKQKVDARMRGREVGTWSVSGGAIQTYSESFDYAESFKYELGGLASGSAKGIWDGFIESYDLGNNIEKLLEPLLTKGQDGTNKAIQPQEINGKAPGADWSFHFTPVMDLNFSSPTSDGTSQSKTIGFALSPNSAGSLTTSVYCVRDSAFEAQCADYYKKTNTPDSIPTYGSFVFFTQAGASMCPYEAEERTKFYNPGTLLNNGTVKIEEPRMEIDSHERSNVPADKPAIFNLRLSNEGQTGNSVGSTFSLTQNAGSNPNGAKIFIDGMPVTGNGMDFFIMSGQSINKVMEVYRGTTDDYENIELRLGSTTCASNADNLKFSVHFLPSSSDVEISSPHDKWIMNTFSPQDSVGYYLPVTIEGFDLNHRGFDHIEFQYKLATQSDDEWVNQCSFYADRERYDAASGNKQMITNGRINTLRFYGERDPMEQQYDLRAVSFCRHGSGFVSKASAVLTGIKDTRPPRVFGYAEPANAILGVGDNLKLRFNEPIAGNYLDEDNNFQLLGTTNNTGITASTSVYFDGSDDSYAKSKVERNLSGKSFSIDMIVKPADAAGMEIFFSHGERTKGLIFGKTADNRLFIQSGLTSPRYSKPLDDPMLAFTRIAVTFDYETGKIRFYAGTKEFTNEDDNVHFYYDRSDLLNFGRGFAGNMLEARLWAKALSQEEIAATNMVRLTGYEQQLAAYYPMNEGKGETLTDKANGATLYTHGTTWTTPAGISLKYDGTQSVQLDQDKLSRTKTQDYTLMFWYKTTSQNATLYAAGRAEATDSTAAKGTWIGLKNGELLFRHGEIEQNAHQTTADDAWHHYVLSVNRTMNTASIYVDSKMVNQFAADRMGQLSGIMYLGADGFAGNIDEFVLYEQAMPKSFIESYDNIAPHGDEMGLIAYLPFEERKENISGIIENVFTANNRLIFKDSEGNVIKKNQLLILEPKDVANMADKNNDAPVRERSQLTKLNFDWAFNHDELLINLNMLDREINKQSIYVTVRNVEDLNGNRMVSPVMWQAFVDRNSLKWDMRELRLHAYYGDMEAANTQKVVISNHSGIRHQFSIESNAEWLSVDMPYGSIDPTDDKTITFTYNTELPVGVYSELVYLTDENGLSEPLRVELVIEAICPWEDEEVDESFANTMLLRGQVYIEKEKGNGYFDSDENDMVAVFCDGKLVGKSNNTFASSTNKSYVYLTIHGNDKTENKVLSFKLWQASTGRVYNLQPDTVQRFVPNAMRGISPQTPVLLTTSAGSLQQINLNSGWNWVSWFLQPNNSMLNALYTAEQGFHNGDVIKTPAGAHQSEFKYNDSEAKWCGDITSMDYRSIYMLYVSQPLTLNIEGRTLNDAQRTLTLKKEWNCVPYLLDEPVNMRDALADYYDKASVGDIIKSRTQFSVFTENHKWEGSLQTMHPGQGYLLRRLDSATVKMRYNKPTANNAPRRHALSAAQSTDLGFSNPRAASNMTMIVAIQDSATLTDLRVYVGDELAGLTGFININNKQFYFVTVQSDKMGDLRFEMNGETLYPIGGSIAYEADAHVGSLKAPVMLTFQNIDNQVYKLIEDNHVVIIRGGEKYDVIGHKLTK